MLLQLGVDQDSWYQVNYLLNDKGYGCQDLTCKSTGAYPGVSAFPIPIVEFSYQEKDDSWSNSWMYTCHSTLVHYFM